MYQRKKSVSFRLPVKLVDTSSNPVTGVTFGSVTVTVKKSDGTTAGITITVSDWFEITFGAFSGLGVYDIVVPASAVDTTGPTVFAVAATGAVSKPYTVDVVDNIESETFARLGAPAGASVSADVAAIRADYTTLRATKLDNLDVAVSTRIDGSDYTPARAVKLDNLDATVSSRATAADIALIPTNPVLDTDPRIAYLDVAISSRADAASYTPTRATKLDNIDLIKAKTDNLPTNTAVTLQAIQDQLVRALGLLRENSLLDSTVFDGDNNMLAGRVRLYDSKANAEAAASSSPLGGTAGLLHTYNLNLTYSGGNIVKYSCVKMP